VSDLSSETRGLLDRAREGDGMPRGHRTVLRRRLALALGVAAPMALSTTALASAALWAARGLAVVGVAGLVHLAVPGHSSDAVPSPRLVKAATATLRPSVAERRAPLPAPTEVPPVPVPVPSESHPVPALVPVPVFAVVPVPHPPVPITQTAIAVHSPIAPRAAIALPVSPGALIPDPSPREDSLAAEVRLLGDAEVAIASGDGSRALERLAEHDRLFPGGALAPEASALRVDALCAAGRTEDAAVEATRFEERYPGSPLARRFASTCARRAYGSNTR